MQEKEFNPTTMTRATPADIARIWKQLWGDDTAPLHRERWARFDGEMIDLTQIAV